MICRGQRVYVHVEPAHGGIEYGRGTVEAVEPGVIERALVKLDSSGEARRFNTRWLRPLVEIVEAPALAPRWEETGDTAARWARLTMRGGIAIEGYPLHVEAYAVDENGDAAHDFCVPMLEGMRLIYPSARFAERVIGGRRYVLCAVPYQR